MPTAQDQPGVAQESGDAVYAPGFKSIPESMRDCPEGMSADAWVGLPVPPNHVERDFGKDYNTLRDHRQLIGKQKTALSLICKDYIQTRDLPSAEAKVAKVLEKMKKAEEVAGDIVAPYSICSLVEECIAVMRESAANDPPSGPCSVPVDFQARANSPIFRMMTNMLKAMKDIKEAANV